MESVPDFLDFQSLSRSSAGSLSRQPSVRSRAVDDAVVSNQTIVYPGDPQVIAPSRSSSPRRTSSLTDLGEEFESTLRMRDLDWALVSDSQVPSLEKVHLLRCQAARRSGGTGRKSAAP